MPSIPKAIISEEEYLELERHAPNKSEYYQGEIFAMAGATKEHNKIVASIIGAISQDLKGKKCAYFPSDLRIHNNLNSLYTYPDVTIVCGEEKYLDDKFDTLLNPTVIFEVLSAATEEYDRGTKFKLYRSIPSLQNYVMVSSTEYAAEIYTRSNDNWILSTTRNKKDSIFINSINLNLALSDIYAQVDKLANDNQ